MYMFICIQIDKAPSLSLSLSVEGSLFPGVGWQARCLSIVIWEFPKIRGTLFWGPLFSETPISEPD